MTHTNYHYALENELFLYFFSRVGVREIFSVCPLPICSCLHSEYFFLVHTR